MVDEQPPLTKEERRQRQKRLEQTRRRKTQEVAPRAVKVDSPPTDEAAPKSDSPPAPRRGRPQKPDVTAADATGLKYFEKLAPLLERLHDVGCARDRAGNRELHYDEFCLLLLLGLFNPVVDSLRLEKALAKRGHSTFLVAARTQQKSRMSPFVRRFAAAECPLFAADPGDRVNVLLASRADRGRGVRAAGASVRRRRPGGR